MKVLIVEDHALIRRGLSEVMREAFKSLEVGEASNFRAAFELVDSTDWDIVLLDINIPGRSGLELLEITKRRRPSTPVLVLSIYPEEEFAIRSFRMGASGYVSKSASTDELLAAIRKLLSGGKYVTPSLAEKLAVALGTTIETTLHENLSPRELQVMLQVARGKSIKEIAGEMGLSHKTVATYRARITEKTGLSTDADLARYAMRSKLVE